MTAIALGLFAALCWSLHDMLARLYAPGVGAYRLAFAVLLAGIFFLLAPVAWNGRLLHATGSDLLLATAMGVAYAVALGGLFKAFSLAPVSVVGPLTSGYPALVVVWGLLTGLAPSALQWLAVAAILAGTYVVSAHGPPDGGVKAIRPGKLGIVVAACAATSVGFAASLILGQRAALTLGEFETTFISRLPAALLILPLGWRDRQRHQPVGFRGWRAIAAMALLDVLAVSGINHAGHYANREFASMAIATYGAGSVLLARLFLKESVSRAQWAGIALLTAGVAGLGHASG